MRDVSGHRFGRLVAIDQVGRRNGQVLWRCRCDCGAKVETVGYSLRSGVTQSCGCLKLEILVKRSRTHGRRSTTEYRIWALMKDRCSNPNAPHWADYGGRGVCVCDTWRDSFEAFYDDMGPRPPSTTLGRIDNDGHYEPTNCEWQSWIKQQNNRRSNLLVTHNGKTMTVAQWSVETGISFTALWQRLEAGWAIDDALTRPIRVRKQVV